MRQRQLIFLIVVVALAANAIGYLVFRSRRGAPATEQPAATAERSGDGVDREQQGQAQRQAGYQALLEGDYDRALIQLTEAKANLTDKSSVEDLLRITDQLRAKKAQAQVRAPAPAPEAPAPVLPPAEEDSDPEPRSEVRPVAKAKPARRAPTPRVAEATRTEPSRTEPSHTEPTRASRVESTSSAPSPEVMGLLLVTSNPRGLLVHVDGVASDLTPMRSSVPAGLHRVALYDGDRKLFETLVDVTESRPTTVVKDLSQELAPPPPPAPTTPAPVAPPSVATKEPTVAAAPKSEAPTGTSRGGLEITSPGLYAEVWVNGRPYGFPPATVRELPAGNADVEIRINGVVKRARTVTVEPGRVTAVKITK